MKMMPTQDKPKYKVMTMDELCAKMKSNGTTQVVNVLDSQYHGLGVIKGSMKIPLSELGKRSCELDKSREVVTYCADSSCAKASDAAAMLALKGYKVSVYEGGVAEWKAAGLPLE
jgi:rhodanese-related sulfurtransferase